LPAVKGGSVVFHRHGNTIRMCCCYAQSLLKRSLASMT
jgi:hypothetical protein